MHITFSTFFFLPNAAINRKRYQDKIISIERISETIHFNVLFILLLGTCAVCAPNQVRMWRFGALQRVWVTPSTVRSKNKQQIPWKCAFLITFFKSKILLNLYFGAQCVNCIIPFAKQKRIISEHNVAETQKINCTKIIVFSFMRFTFFVCCLSRFVSFWCDESNAEWLECNAKLWTLNMCIGDT